MRDIWHLFVDDVRRLTGNVVSVIIVIGLVAIPSLFACSTSPPAGIRSATWAQCGSRWRTTMRATSPT